jgi:tetratricopeptide (TPR) repeat protein
MKLLTLSLAAILSASLLPAAPFDIESSLGDLKSAVEKKDPATVKKLATELSTEARGAAAEAAPADAAEKEAWQSRIDRAKEVDLYAEYALYATAVQSEPAVMVDLLATLEQQNPKSKYLEDAYRAYFAALTKSGSAAKIPAVAEKALVNWPGNPDILYVLADSAYRAKKYDRAATLANRLIAAAGKKGTPGVLGSAYFISGMSYYLENNFVNADKTLRASLTYLKGGDEATLATALYGLCVSNYQIGRQSLSKATMLEGANFCDQAAKLKSPVAQQAWTNAHMIRTEAERKR